MKFYTVSEPVASNKVGLGSQALSIVGSIVGAAIGAYSGINLFIPLFATAVVWWASAKLLKDDKKRIVPALSVNAGHLLWLVLGVALFANLSSVFLDLALYTVGLIWLLMNPSAGPLYLLSIYQVLSIAINGYSFGEATVGSALHKALLVHLIWRTIALFLLVTLYLSLRKQQPPSSASVTS